MEKKIIKWFPGLEPGTMHALTEDGQWYYLTGMYLKEYKIEGLEYGDCETVTIEMTTKYNKESENVVFGNDQADQSEAR
jgi:hypothetical protein